MTIFYYKFVYTWYFAIHNNITLVSNPYNTGIFVLYNSLMELHDDCKSWDVRGLYLA